MTPADRTHLLALAKAATPGPWECLDARNVLGDDAYAGTAFLNCGDRSSSVLFQEIENARYIAAANPATILALLSALEAAERVVEAARVSLAQLDAEGEGGYNNEGLTDSLAAYDAATTAKEGTT